MYSAGTSASHALLDLFSILPILLNENFAGNDKLMSAVVGGNTELIVLSSEKKIKSNEQG